MDRRLVMLEPTRARIIGVQDGLPVVGYPSGKRLVLTTTGRLERP